MLTLADAKLEPLVSGAPSVWLAPAPSLTDVVATYFRALGDPLRLRVLLLLRDRGELSVGTIAAELGVAQPRLSNHLACLRCCCFVATRPEHRVVHYRIADARVAQLLELAGGLPGLSVETPDDAQRLRFSVADAARRRSRCRARRRRPQGVLALVPRVRDVRR